MRWMRSTWGPRLVVALLVGSLLPAVVVPVVPGAQRAAGGTYADWLRLQLPVQADDAFEEAVAAAAEARTLRGFLRSFVRAYEARHPGELADVLAVGEASGEALITYLESRYQRVAGEALPPRATLLKTASMAGKVVDRVLKAAILVPGHSPGVGGLPVSPRHTWITPALRLLRTLSSAQPLGP